MARNQRTISATQREIFEVLLDANAYTDWVVGAQKTRDVDEDWPAPGSSFHHKLADSSGGVKDRTTIVDIDEPRSITLKAYARPLGAADVRIDVNEIDGTCLVVIHESVVKTSKLRLLNPLIEPLIFLRNIEGLRRLEKLVVKRKREREAG